MQFAANKSRLAKWLILVTAVAAVLTAMMFLPGKTFADDLSTAAIVQLNNQARAQAGLAPLSVNAKLTTAATRKANDMIANQYFAHTSPSSVTPWAWITGAGYNYLHAGENLAVDFFDSQSVQDAWMASPGHKHNILSADFSEMGVGIVSGWYDNHTTNMIVVMFGSPMPAKVSTPSVIAPTNQAVSKPTAASTTNAKQPVTVAPQVQIAPVILKDTTPPAVPVISAPADQTWFATKMIHIKGATEVNALVKISDAGTQIGQGNADNNGNFDLLVKLDEGHHAISANAQDGAGNASAESKGVTFSIDITPPKLADNKPILYQREVLTDHDFVVKIYLVESVLGTQASLVWLDQTIAMQPIPTENAFAATVHSPQTGGASAMHINVIDSAGNTATAEHIPIKVVAAYIDGQGSDVSPTTFKLMGAVVVVDLFNSSLFSIMIVLSSIGMFLRFHFMRRKFHLQHPRSLLQLANWAWMLVLCAPILYWLLSNAPAQIFAR